MDSGIESSENSSNSSVDFLGDGPLHNFERSTMKEIYLEKEPALPSSSTLQNSNVCNYINFFSGGSLLFPSCSSSGISSGERRLLVAVGLNNIDMVQQLLRDGVDPNACDDKRRTPLLIASSKGYADIVKLLLEFGGNPNQTDEIGNTPLHLAACTLHVPIVTLLLRAAMHWLVPTHFSMLHQNALELTGTDVKRVDQMGYSPLQLAKSKLRLLQKDLNCNSQEVLKQLHQVVDMMQAYLSSFGHAKDAEFLTNFSNKLNLSDSICHVESSDVNALLESLHELNIG